MVTSLIPLLSYGDFKSTFAWKLLVAFDLDQDAPGRV